MPKMGKSKDMFLVSLYSLPLSLLIGCRCSEKGIHKDDGVVGKEEDVDVVVVMVEGVVGPCPSFGDSSLEMGVIQLE